MDDQDALGALRDAITTEQQDDLEATARIWITQGWRIQSRLPGQIVLVHGKPVNHVLHLLLTLVTLGLWSIAWLIITLTGGERRRIVQLTETGAVQVVKG
jgi:hypothetical protein